MIKKHVDLFKPGQRIPHCHLKAKVTNKHRKTISSLFHQVKLVGAKEPYNMITFDLDPQHMLPGKSIHAWCRQFIVWCFVEYLLCPK